MPSTLVFPLTTFIIMIIHGGLTLATPAVAHDDLQCMEVNNPNNVAFDTLAAFKANRISFDPMKSDYAGNYVEILENLPSLKKDTFLTFESSYIIKLALSKRQVSTIEAGAFLGLNCLHYLRLRSNKIGQISSEMFEGLDELLELSLDNNRLTEVPENVFRHLSSLQTLDLSNNKLSNIDNSPFKRVPTLVNLDLSYNNLDAIPNGAFSQLNKLFKLDLSYNKLHAVPVASWEHLDTLKSFILTGNVLSTFHFDSVYEYRALVYLYLDSNRFKQLNHFDQIKARFPKLLLVELQDNPWNCDDLYTVVHVLNHTKLTYKHGNMTGTNVNGLDCIDYDASTTSTTTTEEHPYYSSSSSAPDYTSSSNAPDGDLIAHESGGMSDALESIKSLTVCILILIILIVLFDFVIRCGILERLWRILGYRNYRLFQPNNYNNTENISLLNTRSGL